MKHLLIFICLSLYSITFVSQSINTAHHSGSDHSGNIVSINSKSFYTEVVYGCCSKIVNLTGTDAAGQTLFTKSIGFHEYNTSKKLIQTSDKCVTLLGQGVNCDVGPNPSYLNFLVKVDTLGIIQFQTLIQNFYPVYTSSVLFDYINDLTQYMDSSYYLVSDSLLYHYSPSGQFISKVNTGLRGINSITVLQSNNLLINSTDNNLSKNTEISVSNGMINQQSSPVAVSKFLQNSSGSLFGITTTGGLQSFYPNLQPLTGSATGASHIFTDFSMRQDSLFTTGVSVPFNQPFYQILDTSFNSLYQVQSNYKHITPSGISLNNQNEINILTTGYSNIATNVSFIGLYQLSLTGSFLSPPDIGVAEISVISASLNLNYGPYSSPVYDMNVKVKNYSNDTIKSFYLNYYGNFGFNCPYLFHRLYTSTILPNDSLTVQTGDVIGPPYAGPNLQVNDIFYQNICLFTTVPNFQNDHDITNDSKCDSFAVTALVGIKENGLADISFSLYPNPSQDLITLTTGSRPFSAENSFVLTNSLGEPQRTVELSREEKTVVLDLRGLKSGMYFLQVLENGKCLRVEKVLKN